MAEPCQMPSRFKLFCMGSARGCITRLLTQAGYAPLLPETHCLVYRSGMVGFICNHDKAVRTPGGQPDNLGHQGLGFANISVSMLCPSNN
jgi:hypothetical protein